MWPSYSVAKLGLLGTGLAAGGFTVGSHGVHHMPKSTTDEAAHDLAKTVGKDPIGQQSRAPQGESLKHHGDELQGLVDKATGDGAKPH